MQWPNNNTEGQPGRRGGWERSDFFLSETDIRVLQNDQDRTSPNNAFSMVKNYGKVQYGKIIVD